jgi:hypothetical protein
MTEPTAPDLPPGRAAALRLAVLATLAGLAITHALKEAIRLCHAEPSCSCEAMYIDMTGGTAAFSAAATVKTLNSRVRLGYVVTAGAPTAGEIIIYEPSVSG